MRARLAPLLLAAALVAAGSALAGAVPAEAAPAPRVLVERTDPLIEDPIGIRVAVLDATGAATPFTGTVRLAVGRTTATATVTGDASGIAVAAVPTAALTAGDATATATIRAGGRRSTVVLPHFAQVAGGFTVGAYSCAVVRPGGGAVRWAVTSMNGEPLRTPQSRDVPLLPYVGSSAPRWTMVDAGWRPLRTSGSVVLRQGRAVVATLRLTTTVRRLVFGSVWNGRVRGAFRPGAYTADLTLRDGVGRTATATQTVIVAAAGASTPCGV